MLRALALFSVVVCACAAPPPPAEGDVVGEGEGDVVGEGEGEGDVVGEGEGDVVGEGEGDVVGEGEGEGDVVGSVYGAGEFGVDVSVVDGDVPLRIFRPTTAGAYPAIVFQHGFLMSTEWYTTLLTHIASHGFVVVAPQMYAANNLPFGKPSISEEAAASAGVIASLGGVDVGGGVSFDGVVYGVGHSRGGKVLWKVLTDDAAALDGVVLLDPVDGSAGGGRVVDDVVDFDHPTLIVGTGKGELDDGGAFSQPCAPDGDSHDEFAGDAPAAAVHVVVDDAGHNDLLDDQRPGCGVCDVCLEGSDPAAVRASFGGFVVAFFDGSFDAAVDDAPVTTSRR